MPRFGPGFEALEEQYRQVPNRWWGIYDTDDAVRAATDMRQQLDDEGWSTLDKLLDRAKLMHAVSVGHEGGFRSDYGVSPGLIARAQALMLMDQGPSTALDDCLDRAMGYPDAPRFESWVRQQAVGVKAVGVVLD